MSRLDRLKESIRRVKRLSTVKLQPGPTLCTGAPQQDQEADRRERHVDWQRMDRASNGNPCEGARRLLHKGLEGFDDPKQNDPHELPHIHQQPSSSLFRLPSEIIQIIAWRYLPWSSEAMLALTCHRMQSTIGTRSWRFHDQNHPSCTECALFDHSENQDIHGAFRSSKERFLDLLARDLPPGSAAVCLHHQVLHPVPNLDGMTPAMRIRALSELCKLAYDLPMDVTWAPSCMEVQLAALGALPAESIAHYQRCLVVHEESRVNNASRQRRLPADATIYGKSIDGSFILAMQYRVWISACGHLPEEDGPGECVCYSACLGNLTWIDRGRESSLCIPLYSENVEDWHGREFVVRQAHENESRYVARTTVRIEYKRRKGIMVLFDIFSDVGQGYRPQKILGDGESLVAVPASLRICDCDPCFKRRELRNVVRDHFKDHCERLARLRPATEQDEISPSQLLRRSQKLKDAFRRKTSQASRA